MHVCVCALFCYCSVVFVLSVLRKNINLGGEGGKEKVERIWEDLGEGKECD